ncbi:hypothetical protein [Chlamydia sp. 17-3921]|uniref:hypothetical protein n=1 Tax=Chlamydia sp. 17-3921 TaxID=2675798 RepID=UPI00191815B2|nr:hypothetical protein [Chlamydia sp. 17-3921]
MTSSVCTKLGSVLRAWLPISCTMALNHVRKVSVSTYKTLNLVGDCVDFTSSCSMLARSQIASYQATPTLDNSAADLYQQRLENLESACSIASGVNNSLSCISLWTQLFSGSLVFETYDDGQFIFTKKQDKEGNVSYSKQVRSPLSILSKICRLASKTVGINNFLQETSVVSLGNHALSVGNKVSVGASMLASGFSLVENTKEVYSHTVGEKSKEENVRSRFQGLRDAVLGLLCDCFDLVQAILGLIFECAPVLLGVHAVFILGIVGILGAAFNFVADFIG